MKYLCLIDENGLVFNKIRARSSFFPTVPDECASFVETSNDPGSPGVGWTYDGQAFSPPEPTDG